MKSQMKKKMSMSQWVAMSQMMNQKMKKDADEEEGEVEDGEEESAEVEEIKTTGQKGGKFTGHYDDLEVPESLLQNTMHTTTTKICMLMRTLVLRLLLT